MRYRVWRISGVLICIIQVIDSAALRCYSGSITNYKEVSLDKSKVLVNTTYLNVTRQTLMYVFGYRGKVDAHSTVIMLNAYLAYDDRNVCLLNWEKETNFGPLVISYPLVVKFAQEIAKYFAKAILDLSDAGMRLDTLQLIGLSLGAHLCGTTGREVLAHGKTIARITGLDPAYPEYDELFRIKQPLSKSDAGFVDIIHTDPGHKGMMTPTGTIDFYANFGLYKNGTNRQPGCKTGPSIFFSTDDLCSHNRAVEYQVQSRYTPEDLQASRAGSYDDWVAAHGEPNNVTYIGDLVNKKYSGVYYLTTNSKSPFGRGRAGLLP